MKKRLFAAYFLLYNFIGFTVSIGGWLWEVALFLIKDGEFANRGFLYGPWLPVYGTGAVLLSLLFYQGGLLKHFSRRMAYPAIFLTCMAGGGLLEYAIGAFLWHVFRKKYWDYSGYPGNISGYVCLFSLLGFGFLGLLWIKWLGPFFVRIWEKLGFAVQILIVGVLDTLFVTDVIFSLMQPNAGENITFPTGLLFSFPCLMR